MKLTLYFILFVRRIGLLTASKVDATFTKKHVCCCCLSSSYEIRKQNYSHYLNWEDTTQECLYIIIDDKSKLMSKNIDTKAPSNMNKDIHIHTFSRELGTPVISPWRLLII